VVKRPSRVLEERVKDVLATKKKSKTICRICEQQIVVEVMQKHCETCQKKAESRKKLLQLNLALADVCQDAYQQKHYIQIQ
jgi:hypothetical protein